MRVERAMSTKGVLVNTSSHVSGEKFRILSLDGGGSKGFYTLGVLREVEKLVGDKPLADVFDIIYGTSTGAIITALLGTGKSVSDILELYRDHVPTIMKRWFKWGKSHELQQLATKLFPTEKFEDFKTHVGIVATDWERAKPMIFKTNVMLAHGATSSFVPGFGCTIAQAIIASCSAYPMFKRTIVPTTNKGNVDVFDGGYCANNPTLYAIADAFNAMRIPEADISVLSIGCGVYPMPRYYCFKRWYLQQWKLELLQKTLEINVESMEQLRKVLFPKIKVTRVNDEFSKPELAIDFVEHNVLKLEGLYKHGIDSFANMESLIKEVVL